MNNNGEITKPVKFRIWDYIEPGPIDYSDLGYGVYWVDRDAPAKMRESLVKMPVFNLEHIDRAVDEAFPVNGKTNSVEADGIVTAVGNENGKEWADIIVWDEQTIKNILENGFRASCQYTPTEFDPIPGTVNGVAYDNYMRDGKHEHMAIVKNPRYEHVQVLRNSKKGMHMKDFWTNFWAGLFQMASAMPDGPQKPAPLPNMAPDEGNEKEEPPAQNMGDQATPAPEQPPSPPNMEKMVEIDGKQMPLSELVAMYTQKQQAPAMANMEDEVDLPNGGKMTVGEMINACKGYNMQQPNAVQNSIQHPTVFASEEPNENFDKLKNAVTNTDIGEIKTGYTPEHERIKTGASRYGSPKPLQQKGA